jgi:hypothetical protein
MQAVCQVVFIDVLIVVRLDVDGQSFAPIGLHKIDAASDWLLTVRLPTSLFCIEGDPHSRMEI